VQTGVAAIDVLMAHDRVADFTSIETKQLSTLLVAQWRRKRPDRAGPQGAAQGGRQVEGRGGPTAKIAARKAAGRGSPHPMPTPNGCR